MRSSRSSRSLQPGLPTTEASTRPAATVRCSTRLDDADAALDGLRRRCCSPAASTSIPAATARRPHPTVGRRSADATTYEIALARAAARARLPLLAICRGVQVLNVARRRHARAGHPERRSRRRSTTRVDEPHERHGARRRVVAGTHAGDAARDRLEAMSTARQQPPSPVRQGRRPGFVVSATAPDGVIEAIEPPDRGSASACSGIRRTSGAPASSAASSRASFAAACQQRTVGAHVEQDLGNFRISGSQGFREFTPAAGTLALDGFDCVVL